MTEEIKEKYRQLQSYYNGLNDVLVNTVFENKAIQCLQLQISMYARAKQLKESGCSLDRETKSEFMRILDLSCDQGLCMSLHSLSDYSKEYSDVEIESDEELANILHASEEELDSKILESRTLKLTFEVLFPLNRARDYIIEHRREFLSMEESFILLCKDVLPNDNDSDICDMEIVKEILHEQVINRLLEECEVDNSHKSQIKRNEEFLEIIAPVLSICDNLIDGITKLNSDEIDITQLHFAFLGYLTAFYLSDSHGCKLSNKEHSILLPYMNDLLCFLKDVYSENKHHILLTYIKNFVGNDKKFAYCISRLQECSELQWFVNDSNIVSISDEHTAIVDRDKELLENDLMEKSSGIFAKVVNGYHISLVKLHQCIYDNFFAYRPGGWAWLGLQVVLYKRGIIDDSGSEKFIKVMERWFGDQANIVKKLSAGKQMLYTKCIDSNSELLSNAEEIWYKESSDISTKDYSSSGAKFAFAAVRDLWPVFKTADLWLDISE